MRLTTKQKEKFDDSIIDEDIYVYRSGKTPDFPSRYYKEWVREKDGACIACFSSEYEIGDVSESHVTGYTDLPNTYKKLFY